MLGYCKYLIQVKDMNSNPIYIGLGCLWPYPFPLLWVWNWCRHQTPPFWAVKSPAWFVPFDENIHKCQWFINLHHMLCPINPKAWLTWTKCHHGWDNAPYISIFYWWSTDFLWVNPCYITHNVCWNQFRIKIRIISGLKSGLKSGSFSGFKSVLDWMFIYLD